MSLKIFVRVADASILYIATFLIGGCAPSYHNYVGLYNATGAPIDNAHVRYDDFVSIGGILIPGYEKTDGPVPEPFPPTALVTWSAGPQGQFYRVTVPLAPVIPKNFEGDIFFRFEPDGTVSVIPVSREDWWNGRDGPRVWRAQARARELRLPTQPTVPPTSSPHTTIER